MNFSGGLPAGLSRAVRYSPGAAGRIPLRLPASFLRSLSAACSLSACSTGRCHSHPCRSISPAHPCFNAPEIFCPVVFPLCSCVTMIEHQTRMQITGNVNQKSKSDKMYVVIFHFSPSSLLLFILEKAYLCKKNIRIKYKTWN